MIFGFASCKKTPLDEYTNGGVLDNETEEVSDSSDKLNGTTWVLVSFTKGYASSKKNQDTITFNQFNYTLNGKSNDNYRYNLTPTMDLGNPFNFVLYGFSPFGDNGMWSCTIVNTFISEGVINMTEFKNSSNKTIIKANFKKID